MKHLCLCVCVRRDSLQKRYRGHGLVYTYVASMLATFASRLVFAAWRLHFVPGPEDVSKITRRLIEASVCWAIVNFTPVGGMERLCGRSGRTLRQFLFLGAAIDKFRQVRRVSGLLGGSSYLFFVQIFVLAATGAASTFSRVMTNQWVVLFGVEGSANVRLAGLERTKKELKRYAVIGACVVFTRRGLSWSHLLSCDGEIGGVFSPMCLDRKALEPYVELARQSCLTMVFAYVVKTHMQAAAVAVTGFKVKPKKVKTK